MREERDRGRGAGRPRRIAHGRHELHLTRLEAEEEDPKVTELRTMLDQRIGEAQLPDLILSIDVEVRFSWIMPGREPRSHQELLMAYAGILAHGTAKTALSRHPRPHRHRITLG